MDANDRTTTWHFDILGRVTSRTQPLGQIETYAYDLAGQRTAHTDFKGQTVEFVYDVLGRPIQSSYPGDVVVESRYTASVQVSGRKRREENGKRKRDMHVSFSPLTKPPVGTQCFNRWSLPVAGADDFGLCRVTF